MNAKPVNPVPTVSQLKAQGEAWDKRYIYSAITVAVLAVGFLAFGAIRLASPARADSIPTQAQTAPADSLELTGAPDVGTVDAAPINAAGPATITGIPVEDSPVVIAQSNLLNGTEFDIELTETDSETDGSLSSTAAAPNASAAPVAPARSRRPDFTTDVFHKVETKDTLYHIALHYYGPEGVVRIKDIIAANASISGSRDLKAGMTIRIPRVPETGTDVSLEPDAVESPSTQAVSTAAAATAKPAQQSAAKSVNGRVHTVKAGETLSGIARQYYGSAKQWKKIFDANADLLKSPDAIRAGQSLTIPE